LYAAVLQSLEAVQAIKKRLAGDTAASVAQ
jgi:hypothetical protein